MKMVISPRLIFYIGFLIFLPGHVSFLFNLDFLEFSKVIGTLVSSYALVQWVRAVNVEKFTKKKNENELAFFSYKMAIPLWSGSIFIIIFFVTWMYLLEVIGE